MGSTQVTINCAERGLLLLRVRDEMRMTIAAYQTLYESSVAFGMRKALQVSGQIYASRTHSFSVEPGTREKRSGIGGRIDETRKVSR